MTLYKSLREVENVSNSMLKEQLEDFIYRYATFLNEEQRESFLELLGRTASKTEINAEIRHKEEEADIDAFLDRLRSCKSELDLIISKGHWLNSKYNENWNDWYDDLNEEIFFSDYFGLLDDIETAIQITHESVDYEQYTEGMMLAEKLASLKVSVRGDLSEYETDGLNIRELYDRDLIHIDFERFVKEAMLLEYLSNDSSSRAEGIMRIIRDISSFGTAARAIENLNDYDLTGFEQFLIDLIDLIGSENNRNEIIILEKAASLAKQAEALIPIAAKYADAHPEIYLNVITIGSDEPECIKMAEVGKTALDLIPVAYVVRSNVALITADNALKCGLVDVAEMCWLEAFRSDTNVTNYLRLKQNVRNWNKFKDSVAQIINDGAVTDTSTTVIPYDIYIPKKNKITDAAHDSFLFFEGQLDKLFDASVKKNNPRYPSGYLLRGASLFKLLIYKGDPLDQCINEIAKEAELQCSFKTDEYYSGLNVPEEERKQKVFFEIFSCWKDSVQIDNEQITRWADACALGIEVLVKDITDNKRRHSYAYCAMLICEYGAVLQSIGKEDRHLYIDRYRSEYSRFRALTKEITKHIETLT